MITFIPLGMKLSTSATSLASIWCPGASLFCRSRLVLTSTSLEPRAPFLVPHIYPKQRKGPHVFHDSWHGIQQWTGFPSQASGSSVMKLRPASPSIPGTHFPICNVHWRESASCEIPNQVRVEHSASGENKHWSSVDGILRDVFYFSILSL